MAPEEFLQLIFPSSLIFTVITGMFSILITTIMQSSIAATTCSLLTGVKSQCYQGLQDFQNITWITSIMKLLKELGKVLVNGRHIENQECLMCNKEDGANIILGKKKQIKLKLKRDFIGDVNLKQY